MTTYNWSALSNGQTISTFNPNADVLNFNDAAISAAALFIDADDTVAIPFISFSYAGKTVTLNMHPLSTTTTNVRFVNGSMFLVGDNAIGTVGDDGANTLTGGAGNDLIVGAGGADSLSGGDGNDVFLMPGTSAAGNFFGNDTINGGNGIDRIEFSRTFSGITVNLALGTATTGDGPPASTLVLGIIENVFGTQYGDTITGDSNDNTFRGRAGNDVLNGGLGRDTADYGSAVSGVFAELWRSLASNDGEGGADTLFNIENLSGSAFNDVLAGDNNNNVFKGGAGVDAIYGGGNNDTADYSDATSGVFAELWRLSTSNDGQGGTDVLVDIENLTGSAVADTFAGDNNDNIFEGGAGNDSIFGGGGSDTADYSGATGGAFVELWRFAAGDDGQGGSDVLVDIENVTGSAFNDTFAGDNNNNVFKGGAGFDALYGAGGIDTADYSGRSSGVRAELWRFWASHDGQDASDTLVDIENLTGSDNNDVLAGDNNNNVFKGGPGVDAMYGTGGIDTVDYSSAASGVHVELWQLWANNDGQGGQDTLFDIENVTGSAFADVLAGDNGANRLEGAGGTDVLYGGGGADNFAYGAGSGVDYIGDFIKVQGDKILVQSNVNGSGITTGALALAHTSTIGGNAVVDLGSGNSVTLVGVTAASLAASDFVII